MGARLIRVRGVVQGVGFRPFVYRLARAHGLCGWVLNGEGGVEIQIEGHDTSIEEFVNELKSHPPPAAEISSLETANSDSLGLGDFTIRESRRSAAPSVLISPDLPICDACLTELFNPNDRRYLYPYINCTN